MSVYDVRWMIVAVVMTTSVAGCICAICATERIIACFEQPDDANLTSINAALIDDVA